MRVPKGREAIRQLCYGLVAQVVVPQKLGWGGGRKQSFLFIFIFLILSLTFLNSPNSQEVWKEDFESYPPGSSPVPPWCASGNTGGVFIDTAVSFSGSKSVRLYGIVGECWGVNLLRPITVPPPFIHEFMIRNGSEYLYGCHPFRGASSLRIGCDWWLCSRFITQFNPDGSMVLGDSTGWHYNELEWVKVTVLYSRPTDTTVHLIYWVNDQQLYETEVDTIWCEDQLAYLEVTAQEGTAWFDDVRVIQIPYLYPYQLLLPLNEDSVRTTVSNKTVTLTWQASISPIPDDTVRYDLYLSRSIVFNPDSTDSIKGLLDTTYTDSLDIKLWYWKVKAYDKWGAVRWSDQSWSFYVYLCGDCNGDGKITVSDVVYEINYLFKGGSAPVPLVAGDVNCDGKETVSDVVYKINYLFKGGPELCKDCP